MLKTIRRFSFDGRIRANRTDEHCQANRATTSSSQACLSTMPRACFQSFGSLVIHHKRWLYSREAARMDFKSFVCSFWTKRAALCFAANRAMPLQLYNVSPQKSKTNNWLNYTQVEIQSCGDLVVGLVFQQQEKKQRSFVLRQVVKFKKMLCFLKHIS